MNDLSNDNQISMEISEFKYSVELLNELNESNYHLYLLSTLKKIDSYFDYLKSNDNYHQILKESNLFNILNKLLSIIIDNKNGNKFSNQIIIILFKYNLDFELNSDKNDNQLFVDDKILKNLINLLKKLNINNYELDIEKLLILIKSSLYYSIDNNLLVASDYKNLFNDLVLKLKKLNLFNKRSQNMLNNLLCSLAILLKLKENDNFINSINFNEFIEYLKVNIDYINCSNMQKLLSCLYFFIINFPECYDLFLKYDGLQFLETIQLDKITRKIQVFIDSKNSSKKEENVQKQETDESSIQIIMEMNGKEEIINSDEIDTQKPPLQYAVDPVDEIIGNWNQLVTSFDELNLKKELLKSIYDYGFNELSAIQQRAILPCVEGCDVVIGSDFGSGKKTTAIISILQQIDNKLNKCQALILTPNQELANQINEMAMKLGNCLGINCYSCGNSFSKDINQLKVNKQIISGTTGRINDLIDRGLLKIDNIKLLVLVETDKILSKDLVFKIDKKLNKNKLQIILLATKISPDVQNVIDQIMKDPFLITTRINKVSFKGIKHFKVNCEKKVKFDTLCDIYETLAFPKFIILCNTKRKVRSLAEKMKNEKINVSYLYGEMSLDSRDAMIQKFRTEPNSILITTTFPPRLIQKVSLIINYDVVEDYRNKYIDKISSDSPLNDKGVIINFVTAAQVDKQRLKNIENYYKLKIEEMPSNYVDYF